MVKQLKCRPKYKGGCGQKFEMQGRPGQYPSLCPKCSKKAAVAKAA